MEEIKAKVLDDTFTTDLGESRDFVESSSNTHLLGIGFIIILILHSLKVLLIRYHYFNRSYGSCRCFILIVVI
jgi:hypothetical protein